jgi:hypothetical protein
MLLPLSKPGEQHRNFGRPVAFAYNIRQLRALSHAPRKCLNRLGVLVAETAMKA